jgi:ABC-2 type transport system ATP-binding protein
VRKPNALRRAVGYMPDFFGVYEALSVAEYLGFFCRAYRVPGRQHATLIAELLALVDLAGLEDRQVDDLSRGMKQRLCLARALVHDPGLLILDEPASGLDPRARVEMRELLLALRELGKTVLISSHILAELQDLCTHVAIVDHGHVVAAGSLDALRTQLGTPRVRVGTLPGGEPALAAAALAAGLPVLDPDPLPANGGTAAPGLVLGLAEPAAVAAAVAAFVAQGVPVTEVVPIRAGLEELFMRITGDVASAEETPVAASEPSAEVTS